MNTKLIYIILIIIIIQLVIILANFEDIIINSEKYTYSAELNWTFNVDSHPNGEGNKIIYDTLNNFRLDIY